jgi:DnaJ-class molecular chaperone
MRKMQKSQAYEILNLNEKNISELEIKKAYRRLSLQHHPQKDNSAESQEKYREVQKAYDLLISEFLINRKVNFGVSKQEIEEFKKEEIKNLTDLSPEDLEKIAKFDRGELKGLSVEEHRKYLEKLSKLERLEK